MQSSEIAEAVISGRKTAARMFGVSAPTVSRIATDHVAAGAQ
jgi:DNA-binding transcriptional regulator YdaS (Cro superfamily)